MTATAHTPSPRRLEVDVAIVGAGFAGLVTARALQRAGREVVVLEARDRVGGRVCDRRLDGDGVLELGGQWLGPGQDRIAALAREQGVGTFPTWEEGDHLLALDGDHKRFSGTIPRIGPLRLADIAHARWRLDRLADSVPLQAPWTAPRARELDAETFDTWLGRTVHTRTARRLLEVACHAVWGGQPEEMSILFVAHYLKAAGGLDRLLDTTGGAQQDRFAGGPMLVAERVAGKLGAALRLQTPARAVRWSGDGVTVTAGPLERPTVEVRARHVVVAVPPPLTTRIEFDPALPAARDQLCQRLPMGALGKCLAVYPTPFWRDDGFNGQAVDPTGPITSTFDNTPPSGAPGILVAFSGGRHARRMAALDQAERRRLVVERLASLYGPRAGRPELYDDRFWQTEQWSGGGPTSLAGPGALSAHGPALTDPIGPIHWAGTETADRWHGYIDGAVRSGERAARAITTDPVNSL
ncbi:MAG: flavin monoamine oxidase family protein [Solirubrobacterales bacterium]